MEEAKKMKCYKRLIYKQFVQASGLCVAHRFWVICRNVSRIFVEFCVETPEINKKYLEFTFSIKLFLFTRELAYVRINISSNTWNGYAAENQRGGEW